MNKIARFAGLLPVVACALTLPATAQQPGSAPHPRNIILFGWDAAQREHVKECLDRGELPTLKQVAAEGTFVDIEVEGVTDTKAGWSEILTGYGPRTTGVYSNGRYQAVPRSLNVFERLKQAFGTNFVCATAIGKKQHCGEIDPPTREKISVSEAEATRTEQKETVQQVHDDKSDNQENAPPPPRRARKRGARNSGVKAAAGRSYEIVEENGVKYRVFGGSPYYYMKDGCNEWNYALMMDNKVGPKTIEMLERYRDRPFFFFVHFAEVDHKGHQHGENSKEYNDALISADTWTGKILAKLKEWGLYDQTLVYITADHGFNEDATNHRSAPHVFLATNDKGISRAGTRADVTPTILDRFGVDLEKLRPRLDGASLARPLSPKPAGTQADPTSR